MTTLATVQKIAIESKLHRLAQAVNTTTVDEILDEILNQLANLGTVSCSAADDSGLMLRTKDKRLAHVVLPHAKKILRLICARLAVRASEWTQKEVSPYGDSFELKLPALSFSCEVSFANTPAAQWFEFKKKKVRQLRSQRKQKVEKG